MMEVMPRDEFASVAVTLWAIWYARRKMIHEDIFQSPLSTHLFIQSYLRDLAVALMNKKNEKRGGMQRAPRWIPPAEGCVKMNVDAALRKSSPGGAVAVVCHRADGFFLRASSLTVEGISEPSVLEAMACQEALALAQDLHVQRITVASDCLAVISDMARPYS
jgi:hypothetical protein